MIELKGDIWNYHPEGWIAVTTNGFVKPKNGQCVMGRGIALEAAKRFPGLSVSIGKGILRFGNQPLFIKPIRLLTFPVKHNWWEPADLDLIKASAEIIREAMYGEDALIESAKVFTVRPGCGAGKLDWKDVQPVLEKIFPTTEQERFFVVDNKGDDDELTIPNRASRTDKRVLSIAKRSELQRQSPFLPDSGGSA